MYLKINKICNKNYFFLKPQKNIYLQGYHTHPIIPANGHPMIALAATASIAAHVWFRNQPPMAIMVMYIAKLLGRNAEQEINIPLLSRRMHSARRPVFAPNWRHMPLEYENNLFLN
jgi:hypothetical protein